MLDGLDEVDWAGVEHAYGPATEVPGWIRAIAAAPKPGKAFSAFTSAVNHQGWATPAAAPAAPFLLELVRARTGPVADLTVLLADLAAAGDHANVIAHGFEPPTSDPLFVALRGTVASGLDDFIALLADPDPARRAAACVPLAVLEEHAARSMGALRDADAKEAKPEPLACVVLAMGWLGARSGDRSDLARIDARGKHRAAVVRAAAAIASAWLDPSSARAAELVAGLAGMTARFKVAFVGGELRDLAAGLIARSMVDAGDVEGLLALEAAHGLFGVRHLLELVLAAVMPASRQPPEEPILVTDLSPRARAVATRLVTHVVELRAQKNVEVALDAFERRGMPNPARLLGVLPAGPLDAVFAGEPLWRYARRARDGRAALQTWKDAIDGWAGDDRTSREALAADVLANGHTLSLPYPYRHEEVLGRAWARSAAHTAVVSAALEGLAPSSLAALIAPPTHRSARVLAVWVRALGGQLDDVVRSVVIEALASPTEEPSAGRALVEALPAAEREQLAATMGFDILARMEQPPAVYLRGAYHWLDLSPALTRRLVSQVAAWTRAPEAKDTPFLESAIEDAVVDALARGASVMDAAREALPTAEPAGRRILERVLTPA